MKKELTVIVTNPPTKEKAAEMIEKLNEFLRIKYGEEVKE